DFPGRVMDFFGWDGDDSQQEDAEDKDAGSAVGRTLGFGQSHSGISPRSLATIALVFIPVVFIVIAKIIKLWLSNRSSNNGQGNNGRGNPGNSNPGNGGENTPQGDNDHNFDAERRLSDIIDELNAAADVEQAKDAIGRLLTSKQGALSYLLDRKDARDNNIFTKEKLVEICTALLKELKDSEISLRTEKDLSEEVYLRAVEKAFSLYIDKGLQLLGINEKDDKFTFTQPLGDTALSNEDPNIIYKKEAKYLIYKKVKERIKLNRPYDAEALVERLHDLSHSHVAMRLSAADMAADTQVEAIERAYYNGSEEYSQDYLRFLGVPSHSKYLLITQEYPEGWLESVSALRDIEFGSQYMRIIALQTERFEDKDDDTVYTVVKRIVKDGQGLLIETEDGKLIDSQGKPISQTQHPSGVDAMLERLRKLEFQRQEGDLKTYSFYFNPSQRQDCLGRYGVSDVTVTTLLLRTKEGTEEVIYAYSNYTTIDTEGNVPYSTVLGRARLTNGKGDEEITYQNLHKSLINGNTSSHGKIHFDHVYESRVEVKDNMGRIIGIGNGFRARQLDPEDSHYFTLPNQKPPSITFLYYPDEGDTRIAAQSNMYTFNDRANHDREWYDRAWYENNAAPVLSIEDPELEIEVNDMPVIVYKAIVRDSSLIDAGQRGLIEIATRLADGRPYYARQRGIEGPRESLQYFDARGLPAFIVIAKDSAGINRVSEDNNGVVRGEPYRRLVARFEDPQEPMRMTVYSFNAEEGAFNDVSGWLKTHPGWVPGLPREYEEKRIIENGNSVSREGSNRTAETFARDEIDVVLLPDALEPHKPGTADRLNNNSLVIVDISELKFSVIELLSYPVTHAFIKGISQHLFYVPEINSQHPHGVSSL
ncbi:hypothetical protein ACFL2W_00735, partial [Candidatus Omnitrophota bacterium]